MSVNVFASSNHESRTKPTPVTGNKLGQYRVHLDTAPMVGHELVASDTTEAGSSDSDIVATSHLARTGDIVLLTSGSISGDYATVSEVTVNGITLAQKLSATLGAGVDFKIYRPRPVALGTSGGTLIDPCYSQGDALGKGFAIGGADSGDAFSFLNLSNPSSALDAGKDFLLVAAALYGDFLGNPTALKSDSAGNLKTTEYGPLGLPNFYNNVLGIVEIPLCSVGDPTSALVAGVSGDVTPTGAKNGIQVNGNIAHDAVDDSNAKPVKIGSTASTAAPTAVAVGDRVNMWLDTRGRVSVFSDTLSTEATLSTLSGKLSSAAALADNVTNPTVASYGVYNAIWDSSGSRWHRQKGDLTSGTFVGGAVAHDGADTGNPVKIGMKSRTALVTAVANGDRSDWSGNTLGFGGVTLAHNNRNDTFTTTANGTTLGDGFQNWKYFTLSVRQTGTVTSWTVVLEVSLDNTTFSTVLTHTNATGSGVVVFSADAIPRPVLYMRARCSAIVLGGGTNVISTIIGVQ